MHRSFIIFEIHITLSQTSYITPVVSPFYYLFGHSIENVHAIKFQERISEGQMC